MRKTHVREKDLVIGTTYWTWEYIRPKKSCVHSMVYVKKGNDGYLVFSAKDQPDIMIWPATEMRFVYDNQEAAANALLTYLSKLVNEIQQLMSEVAEEFTLHGYLVSKTKEATWLREIGLVDNPTK